MGNVKFTLIYSGSWNNELITIIIIILFFYVIKILISKCNSKSRKNKIKKVLKKILSIIFK